MKSFPGLKRIGKIALLLGCLLFTGCGSPKPSATFPGAAVTTPAESGWPNTWAELDAWYAKPPLEQDGTALYLAAFNELRLTNASETFPRAPIFGTNDMPTLGKRFSTSELDSAKHLLKQNEKALKALNQATRYDAARYPIDLKQGFDARLGHLPRVKSSACLGELYAWVNADLENQDAATETYLKMFALNHTLISEPLFISQLVRSTCITVQQNTLERILNLTPLSEKQLKLAAMALANAETEEAAGIANSRALAGARVGGLVEMDLPLAELKRQFPNRDALLRWDGKPSVNFKQFTQNLKAQRNSFEETFNHGIWLRKHPFPERLESDKYFFQREELENSNKFYLSILCRYPDVKNTTTTEAMSVARLRLSQVAIALEQYRKGAGNRRYPETLAALVPSYLPAIPADPFDGKSLRYQKKDDGYLAYSIGPDLKDDQGEGDISFCVIKGQ